MDTLPSNLTDTNDPFVPVVGIGSSAGGLEAFKTFAGAIPQNSGMAFLLIQHLHRDFESSIKEILKSITTLPVFKLQETVELKPNHIYYLPSNKMLEIGDGKMSLVKRQPLNQSIHPIDKAFEALAENFQSHAIGIILSGTGSDGTIGLKKIKDFGGFSFAQSPDTAAYDSMPSNAIQAQVVDFVLPPDKMPAKLEALYHTLKIISGEEDLPTELQKEEGNFKHIISMLRVRRGIDFTYYKQATIRRRILRRMVISKIENLSDYLQYLRTNKGELDVLYQDMLIPVTGFFRDTPTFERLCENVFPTILQDKSVSNTLRIWVAGCSTGEEAYSVGICLMEYLGEQSANLKVQIFATDVSEKAIAFARHGIYNKREIQGMSENRLKQYFTKTDGAYQLKKSIRDLCIFAVHDFLKDPPFARIDLLCCRNVLIYMENYLQRKALTTFHYALNPKGILLLGKSESVSAAPEIFAPASNQDKLFSRKTVAGRFVSLLLEKNELHVAESETEKRLDMRKYDFQKNADDILLKRFTPPGVVVNEHYDIVQFRGSTGSYLEAAPGKASLNILKMAREGLAFEIRHALHQVKATNEAFREENIQIANGNLSVSIEVIPLLNTIEPHYLILFKEARLPGKQSSEADPSTVEQYPEEKSLVKQLEKTIRHLREDMRTITEEQEAANEELQSANEELLSGSEELQSLNEELETSKEELQSSNEELMTVNQELFERNDQYNQARIFAETVLTTIHEPFIVLNRDLRIKTANQSFLTKFNLREDQITGRILFELQDNNWDIPDLRTELLKVQTGKLPQAEWEVVFDVPNEGARNLLLNAKPINRENDEQWILLAFDDITLRKIAEKKVEETTALAQKERKLLQEFVRQNPAMLFVVKGPENKIHLANDGFRTLLKGIDPIDKSVFECLPRLGLPDFAGTLKKVKETGQPFFAKEVPVLEDQEGDITCYVDVSVEPLLDENNIIDGLMVFQYDVTRQVIDRKASEKNANTLQVILEAMPQMAWTAAADGSIQFFNKQWYDYSGKTITDSLTNGWKSIVHPGMLEERMKKWQFALDTGNDYIDEFLARRASDGMYRWQLAKATNVRNNEGHIELWVGTLTDIHDQRVFSNEMERQVAERTESLKNSNLELLHSNQSLEQFAYIASHDLQEPLRKVRTFTTIFKQKYTEGLPEEAKQLINKVQFSSERMSTLIRDVLNYSRIAHDQTAVTSTNLNDIFTNVVNDFDLMATELQATIKSGPLPVIEAVPLQMNQLFYNLLSNSLKFIDKNRKPVIEVSARLLSDLEKQDFLSLDPHKAYTHITFKDNGIGFEHDFAEQIFMIFQRLHNQVDYDGTGIGLALCQKIVFFHQGLIWAQGKPGEGAVFNIILPLKQALPV